MIVYILDQGVESSKSGERTMIEHIKSLCRENSNMGSVDKM